ncbi:hypothetical protein IQ06DRAFT_293084, partial [Phaeosphaeriaceae sp. SRC1lsM3a]
MDPTFQALSFGHSPSTDSSHASHNSVSQPSCILLHQPTHLLPRGLCIAVVIVIIIGTIQQIYGSQQDITF